MVEDQDCPEPRRIKRWKALVAAGRQTEVTYALGFTSGMLVGAGFAYHTMILIMAGILTGMVGLRAVLRGY